MDIQQLMDNVDLGKVIQFIWQHKFWLAAAVPIIIAVAAVRGITR